MRSSKNRSRSKSNRNRSVGNIVNRVFESSGPEGKVRGTPQQIIEKYTQLARDAQLANDRVAFENFQQHAEHYTRLLSEAQREQDARREQQERDRERQQQPRGENAGEGQGQGQGQGQQGQGRSQAETQPQSGSEPRGEPKGEPRSGRDDDVIDVDAEAGAGLVETPESKPRRPRRSRAKPRGGEAGDPAPDGDSAPEAAE